MDSDDNPFLYVTDLDAVPPEEREAYTIYWAGRTSGERLSEVYRLNRAKWGDEVFERGMDKTRLEIINRDTGEITIIDCSGK